MNTERLFGVLSELHPLTNGFKKQLREALFPLSLPKSYFLLQDIHVAQHAYFLEKGFAVSFQSIDNKKVVTSFWDDGAIIFSPRSFFDQIPAHENIQILEDSILLAMTHESIRQLIDEFPEASLLALKVVKNYFEQSEKKAFELVCLSAWERYGKLINAYPGIEQKISQEMLATYLGITPQSLSRLKKKKKGLW